MTVDELEKSRKRKTIAQAMPASSARLRRGGMSLLAERPGEASLEAQVKTAGLEGNPREGRGCIALCAAGPLVSLPLKT